MKTRSPDKVSRNLALRRLRLFRGFRRVLVSRCGYHPEFELNHVIECLSTGWGGRVLPAAQVKNHWLSLLRRIKRNRENHLVSLFIATPYCLSECDYCRHFRMVGNAKNLERFKTNLCRSIEFYADVFGKIKFSHIYFGGGTPSLFSERQLEEISAAIARYINFDPKSEATVECNPASISPGKLRVFRNCGFNRISIGVQSLDKSILRKVRREYQTPEMVKNAILFARRAGFMRVNADLIIGLAGDDGRSFLHSFKTVAAFRPDTIQVYPCEPTTLHLQRHYDSSRELFERHLRKQEGWFYRAVRWGKDNGFVTTCLDGLGRSPGLLKRLPCMEFRARGIMRVPEYDYGRKEAVVSVFGLGHHANSYIFGSLRYHSALPADNPEKNLYRGSEFSGSDEMSLNILDQFARGKPVSLEKFRKTFGARLEKVFSKGISCLKTLGKLKSENGNLYLLPFDPDERFACALFFLGAGQLAKLIKTIKTHT